MTTEEKVLEIFLKNPNKLISGQIISESLNVSRNAVWKNISNLRQKGYVFESVTNNGYQLKEYPVLPEDNYLRVKLSSFWSDIIVLDNVESTNTKLKMLGDMGGDEGTIVIAKRQEKGKGRLGRKWCSEAGGLWVSFLLRPKLEIASLSMLTLTIAAVVREAIKESFDIETEIKWPNDILYQNKKIAGILTEVKGEMDNVEYVVVGIGINCNNVIDSELLEKAVSLSTITGREININDFLLVLSEKLLCFYEKLVAGDNSLAMMINKKYSYLKGKTVAISSPKGVEIAKALDIAEDGCLIVEQNKEIKKVVSGDVSLYKSY